MACQLPLTSAYYHPRADADAICNALVALSNEDTDRVACLMTVAQASMKLPWYQRYRLAEYSKVKHGDVQLLIRGHTDGELQEALLAMFQPAAERDAEYIHDALNRVGTDEGTLGEVICTCSPYELEAIGAAYEDKYGRPLVDDVKSDLGGDLEDLIVKLLTVPRKAPSVDQAAAESTAEELYKAGEGRWGTNEGKFIEVLTTESFPQLCAIFEAYKVRYGRSVVEAAAKEIHGKLGYFLKTLCHQIEDSAKAAAYVIHKATKGMGTNKGALVRNILCKVDTDLHRIAAIFQNVYGGLEQRLIGESRIGDDLRVLLKAAIKTV
eukprot:TRINITY_DN374_c0_g1_i1.p1 TRINITY_DN374_c0_g1~~TRINITY_DN374_c0_g1_i1.p1  ORF type:complete len:323 (+),score=78.31 TRINITY_DN374_c0_g1_i1:140-1108(+)